MIIEKLNKKKTNLNFILKSSFIILLTFVLIVIFYELYNSYILKKKFSSLVNKFSQNYEYTLKELQINSLKNIEFSQIEKYFIEYYGKSIFLIPIQEISKMLNQNKWIDKVAIKSNYKDMIIISITETIPIGIFYNNGNYLLFSKNGEIIDFANYKIESYSKLIKFKGKNSLYNANLLLESIPLIFKKEIEEAIFINNRRWDVKLKNGNSKSIINIIAVPIFKILPGS